MSVNVENTIPPEEIGFLIAEQFAEGATHVRLQNVPFTRLEGTMRAAYIRRASGVLGELSLSTDDPASDVWQLDTASSPNASRIPYHTDNPFYDSPERFIGFWNLKSSPEGGENVLLTVDDLLEQVSSLPGGDELLQELRTRQITFSQGSHCTARPVLDAAAGTIRYDRRYTDPHSTILADQLTQILKSSTLQGNTIKLAEGDVLFFDNRRLLHAREPYIDLGRVSMRVRVKDANDS